MEDCYICLAVPSDNNWKELGCSHKMCFSCFIRLANQTCPFCRKEFRYTNEEIIMRQKLNIKYSPPSQLYTTNRLINSFTELNINTIEDYDYNIPNSRLTRNRYRKRRRNLPEEEIKERRRIIKEKCKRKWTNKENRLKKWYEIIVE